jgi:glucarate dehydratase
VNPSCEILGGHGNVAARAIVRLTTADGFVGVSETYGNEQVISDLNRRSKLVERMDPYKRKPLELQIRDPMTSNAFETALYGSERPGPRQAGLLAARWCGPRRGRVFGVSLLIIRRRRPRERCCRGGRGYVSRGDVQRGESVIFRCGFEVLKLKGGILEPDKELRMRRLLRTSPSIPNCSNRLKSYDCSFVS